MSEKIWKVSLIIVTLGLSFGLLGAGSVPAAPGDVERVSLYGDPPEEGENDATDASISGDGRYVFFKAQDLTYELGLYVHDRQLDETTEISFIPGFEAYSCDSPDISADGETLVLECQASGEDGTLHKILILDWQSPTWTPIAVDPPLPDAEFFNNPSISGDGCRVAYEFVYEVSPDYLKDVFIFDCISGTSSLVSRAHGSAARGNKDSENPEISDNGLFVAFTSRATDLVTPPLTGDVYRVYVRDLAAGATELIPVPAEYAAKNGDSYNTSISADGHYVAFDYGWKEGVEPDIEYYYEVFVHDRQTDETSIVSLLDGLPSGDSAIPSISADGRFVAFDTYHSYGGYDIHVHDRLMSWTKLVSRTLVGLHGNGDSDYAAISADGRFIAFESEASDLVSDDTNGMSDIFVYENDLSIFYKYLPLIRR